MSLHYWTRNQYVFSCYNFKGNNELVKFGFPSVPGHRRKWGQGRGRGLSEWSKRKENGGMKIAWHAEGTHRLGRQWLGTGWKVELRRQAASSSVVRRKLAARPCRTRVSKLIHKNFIARLRSNWFFSSVVITWSLFFCLQIVISLEYYAVSKIPFEIEWMNCLLEICL